MMLKSNCLWSVWKINQIKYNRSKEDYVKILLAEQLSSENQQSSKFYQQAKTNL